MDEKNTAPAAQIDLNRDEVVELMLKEGMLSQRGYRTLINGDCADLNLDFLTRLANAAFARAQLASARQDAEPLDPVAGDLLPPVRAKVLIHFARQDAWIEHTVVGYYVWGALSHQVKEGEKNAHRVFVRVKDADGYDNARLLSEVRMEKP